jgi:5-oxoprolinase (ATP-hydrolysing) subunit A
VVSVDLNCDLGEGAGHDVELMPLITSANIACGAHAGDEDTMRATVALAEKHGVAIGAHPGFADREHFGRRELPVTAGEVFQLVLTQTRRLQAMAAVRHVKPHGALYNQAARDRGLADAVAAAVRAADPGLILVGLAGSELLVAGRAAGLTVASEVFADRAYRRDGKLVPRSEAGALINDPAQVATRAVRMVSEGRVPAAEGGEVSVTVDTICLHGDGVGAVAMAGYLRRALAEAGLAVRSRR